MKEQSKWWILQGEPAPKKVKAIPSAGKIMATVFGVRRAFTCIDYLERGKTIKEQSYAKLLNIFGAVWKENQTHLFKKKNYFLFTTTHSFSVVTVKLTVTLRVRICTPDLITCDFFLFEFQKSYFWTVY